MAKKNILLKSDEVIARADAAAFLRQISDALEKGTVVLKQGATEVSVDVPAQVELEVQVDEKPKKKGKKLSMEFELEWMVSDSGEPMEGVTVE